MSEFSGKLTINVIRGRDLAVDLTGSSDPYCILDLDKQKFKTKTIARNNNPVWDQTFVFNVTNPVASLEIVVMDENVGADTFAGKITVPLIDLSDQNQVQKWLKLKKRHDKDNVSGEISVSMTYKYLPVWDVVYKGCNALKQRNYTAALKLLDESISKNSENEGLYGFRSEVQLAIGNIKEAQNDAQKILQLNPNIAEGYYRLGEVYFAAEDYTQAEEAFKMGLKYEPEDEKCAEALKDINTNMLKQTIRNAIARGRQAYEREDYALAITYFTDAIEKNPRNCIYYVYRSIANSAFQKDAEALEDALQITVHQPNWPKINPTKQGFLMKEGKVNVMLKKRWFILKHSFLFYYNSSKDLKPNGAILLGNFDLQKSKKLYLRIVTRSRTFELKSETEQERNSWVEALEKLLNNQHQLPLADDENETAIFSTSESKGPLVITALTDVLTQTVSTTVHAVYVPGMIVNTVTGKIASLMTSLILDDTITHQGWLYKTGQLTVNKMQFKKRYWILKDKYLYYCNSKDEEIKKGVTLTPSGYIELDANCKVELAQEKAQKEFAFEVVTPARRYLLSANNEEDMIGWMKAISKVCGDEFQYKPPVKEEASYRERRTMKTADPVLLNEEEHKRLADEPKIIKEREEEPVPASYAPERYATAEARYFLKFGLTPPAEQSYTATSTTATSATVVTTDSQPNDDEDATEDKPLVNSTSQGSRTKVRRPPPKKENSKCCIIL